MKKRKGRPTIDGTRNLRHVTATLDYTTIKTMAALANGNVSAGIRRAGEIIRAAAKKGDQDVKD